MARVSEKQTHIVVSTMNRIAYVTTYDASDVLNWSGLGFYISQALLNQGLDVDFIGRLANPYSFHSLMTGSKKAFYRYLLRKNYLRDRDPALLRGYARTVAKRLQGSSSDWVFCPGTIPVSYLECKQPIAFWTDVTFAGIIDFYKSYAGNLCSETLQQGHAMEQSILDRCRLAIYASDWAAQTAIDSYGAMPEKVEVVPFGANIECDRTPDDISQIVAERTQKVCRLLFIGVDWERKGGDIAYKVTKQLRESGLDTELTVVGCQPVIDESPEPHFVKHIGFIKKSTPEGRARLNKLLAESHFLILPSQAECLGVVFCEASSFGLPSIATNVGGISAAVRNGKNGYTFDLNAEISEYCQKILYLFNNYDVYQALSESSFEEYQTRLNWQVAGQKVKQLILERS